MILNLALLPSSLLPWLCTVIPHSTRSLTTLQPRHELFTRRGERRCEKELGFCCGGGVMWGRWGWSLATDPERKGSPEGSGKIGAQAAKGRLTRNVHATFSLAMLFCSILPLRRKGDSHRGISLLSMVGKCYASVKRRRKRVVGGALDLTSSCFDAYTWLLQEISLQNSRACRRFLRMSHVISDELLKGIWVCTSQTRRCPADQQFQ